MTAGMAANKPTAVAKRASEIPGATVAKLADPAFDMARKEFIIPTTVPSKQINGPIDNDHASQTDSYHQLF